MKTTQILLKTSSTFYINETIKAEQVCQPDQGFEPVDGAETEYELCTVNSCERNGTCSTDLDYLRAAVGPQVVEEYMTACVCKNTSPKSYGQSCQYTDKNEFKTKEFCKCQHGGQWNYLTNPITGCDCEETGFHGWYCERADALLCKGNTVYAGSPNVPGVPVCYCLPGFYGSPEQGCPHTCDVSDNSTCPEMSECKDWNGINACFCQDANSCSNHGHCNAEKQCKCDPGYKGEMCEVEKSCEEDGDVCLNGGTCTNSNSATLHNVTCNCPIGFSGEFCERQNPCHPDFDTCGTGVCSIDSDDNYECHCRDDTTGQTCPKPTPCDDEPCLNGGQCQLKGALFECHCESGFHGNFCQHKNICHPDHNPCGNGTCELSMLGTYECTCFDGSVGTECEPSAEFLVNYLSIMWLFFILF